MQVINEHENQSQIDDECRKWEKQRRRGKIVAGIVIVIAGAIWLAKRMGAEIPSWVLSWPMLFVAIGIGSLFKHGAKNFRWVVFLAIGALFLFERASGDHNIRIWAWPVVVMLIGLAIIFKPRNKYRHYHHQWRKHWGKNSEWWDEKKKNMYNSNADGDTIEVNAVFGGTKKIVFSKNFKGGEVNAVFGGSEINLSQADIDGVVRLEVNQVFGSTTLIVPPHWKIQPQFTSVLGGIEDQRTLSPGQVQDENKVLALEGNCVFGGLQIKSF